MRTNDPECRYLPAQKRDGFGDHRRQTMFFCVAMLMIARVYCEVHDSGLDPV